MKNHKFTSLDDVFEGRGEKEIKNAIETINTS